MYAQKIKMYAQKKSLYFFLEEETHLFSTCVEHFGQEFSHCTTLVGTSLRYSKDTPVYVNMNITGIYFYLPSKQLDWNVMSLFLNNGNDQIVNILME